MTDRSAVFEGFVRLDYHGEAHDILFLDPSGLKADEPLARVFADRMAHAPSVTVRYFLSDRPLSEDERTDAVARMAVGEGEAEYVDRYSEVTGYLWTDENLVVGGHDLIREIGSHQGKWCRLEATFHDEGPRAA